MNEVEFELTSNTASPDENATNTIEDSTNSVTPKRGAASRYIEAIISSMKLFVNINNLSFRVSSANGNEEAWAALKLSSIVYRNSSSTDVKGQIDEDETRELSQPISFKELTLGSLALEVGGYSSDDADGSSEEFVSTDGNAEVQLTTLKRNTSSNEHGIDHDWKVTLDQEILFNIHVESLMRLTTIGEDLKNTIIHSRQDEQEETQPNEKTKKSDDTSQLTRNCENVDVEEDSDEEEEDDDPYVGLLSNILKDQEETDDDKARVEGTDFEQEISLLDDFFETDGEENIHPTENEHGKMCSRICLYIKDISMKTYLNTAIQTDGSKIADVLITTIVDFSSISTKSSDEFEANISIQEFDIEDATLISVNRGEEKLLRSGILLRFVQVRPSS